MIETYKPSGGFAASIVVYALLAAVWMCAGMFIYQFLLYWIPFIYINFLLTMAAGFIGAYAVTKAVKAGKCRSPMLAATIGLAAAVVAIGVKHYFQYDALIAETATALIDEWRQEQGEHFEVSETEVAEFEQELRGELSFLQHFSARADQGWSIGRNGDGGLEVKGIFVYLIWLIEAGIIGYFAVTGPYAEACKPFNEDLQVWADDEEDIGIVAINDDAIVTQLKGAQSVDELLRLPEAEPEDTNEFLTYTVQSIAGEDREDAYLSIAHSVVTMKKGESQTRENDIWKFAVLPAAKRAVLLQSFEELQQRRESPRDEPASPINDAE